MGKKGKTVNFGALLPDPATWNHKFMFNGCAYNCGEVFTFGNPADALGQGFPLWATDDGHTGTLQVNPSWPVTAPGQPNVDTIVDFAYRAVHTVTVVGKQFTLNYYHAADLSYSYWEGCSDGGREGMVEADRYPADYDGILAGAPYFIAPGEALNLADATVQLRAPDAILSPNLLAIASNVILQQCDAVDGVKDGLIQDPALCNFNPQTDLPRCIDNAPGSNCFTQDQIDSLSAIISGFTDQHGEVIHPGFSVADFGNPTRGDNLSEWVSISTQPSNFTGPEPWPNYVGAPLVWLWADPTVEYLVYYGEPGYNSLTTPDFSYHSDGPGPIRFFHESAPDRTIDTFFDRMNIAAGDFPDQLQPFLSRGGKLILYHGYSDGLITPYGTIQYYRELARMNGGLSNLGDSVRLFLVPGMYHCEGGPGPNDFGQFAVRPAQTDALHDATTALEDWVEKGEAPQEFIASKFSHGHISQPALRTMPLCPYPAEAQYSGSGDVNDAANWSCSEHDSSLLRVGLDGREAGADAPLFNGEESHEHVRHHRVRANDFGHGRQH